MHRFSYHIDRADIVGKLFFYLWDNVFDRDKSPLCTLLGLDLQKLRTFGQFADQAERFVECLCPETMETAASPVLPAENTTSAPETENVAAEEV